MASKITVEVFFDVGSMYSYCAVEQLVRYTCGKDAPWSNVNLKFVPFLLGGVFKATGNAPPAAVPAKAPYLMKDVERHAHYLDLPMNIPSTFPTNTINAMRLLTAVSLLHSQDMLIAASRAIFKAYWVHDADIRKAEILIDALVNDGSFSTTEATTLLKRANGADVKDLLKQRTDDAVSRGAFGAPSIFVPSRCLVSPYSQDVHDNESEEMFFGSDRLHLLAHSLGLPWFGPHPVRSKL
eukprot:GDKH01000319.1.p1 GENE.GDKH01000319.1~~GDKH01000319.1.p1  ORF type:complete len:239 (-),score=30.01 GDKH01000319.1:188-904(-)